MSSTPARAALLASCLLLTGCGDDGVRPCDLWFGSAVVWGHVTHASGVHLPNATIDVHVAMRAACDTAGEGDWFLSKQVTTDANGNYSTVIDIGNDRGVRCVRVTEPASGTWAQGDVEFVGGCEDTRPPRELILDVVIP